MPLLRTCPPKIPKSVLHFAGVLLEPRNVGFEVNGGLEREV
jgi:hypothetical protein